MQAWQEEVERARQGQRDAESKLSSLEACFLHFAWTNKHTVLYMYTYIRHAYTYNKESDYAVNRIFKEMLVQKIGLSKEMNKFLMLKLFFNAF